MGEQGSGLTLQGLSQKLEALTEKMEAQERENKRVRSENARLQREVAALRGAERAVESAPDPEGRVSRRALLTKAGAAAVAAVAAGTLLNPREARASHYNDGIEVNHVLTHHLASEADPSVLGTLVAIEGRTTTTTEGVGAVQGLNDSTGPGVKGFGGTGVWGVSQRTGHSGVYGKRAGLPGYGVTGDGDGSDYAGVLGRNPTGAGIRGEGTVGVYGQTGVNGNGAVAGAHAGTNGYGVVGDGKGPASGVLGRNSAGTGVRGEGSTTAEVAGVRGLGKTGVWGSTAVTGYSGVRGQHTGSVGYGVFGEGTGNGAGVLGRNSGAGYGGQFEGGRAQLWLKPAGRAGKPTTGAHTKGELYMDSAAKLFVCTASGTPGTWRRISTTTA
jgi:hypothetical protein